MARGVVLASVGWLTGLSAHAGAPPAGRGHATSLGVGVGWHDGPRQVVIGVGPRVAHSFQLDPDRPWQVGGALERLWLVVPTVGLAGFAGLVRPTGTWHPGVSLEVMAYPSRLRKLTAEHPTPTRLPATSLRVRLSPLDFDVGPTTRVSALSLAPGLGLDTPTETLAFGVSLFTVAHRW